MNKNKSSRPNIIIFNPDQWRGDVLGHMGNLAAYTPNLDKIVEEDAVSFRHAFCQNPVCTPSRCSFMTGWYPHTRGHRTMYYMLHPEHYEQNLLKILKENKYYVWWGGKNDLVPGQHGYYGHANKHYHGIFHYLKHVKQIKNQAKIHMDDKQWRGLPEGSNYYSFHVGNLKSENGKDIFIDDTAKVYGAIDFIKKYRKKNPFCIYLPLSFPHPPYMVDDIWYEKIDKEKLPKRREPPENWKGKAPILEAIWKNQHIDNWDDDRWNELRATYYGMCAKMDNYFGLLIQALKDSGEYDNTCIFFFSDHGDYTGDFGIVEKNQNTFEDCLSRVPFIIKPPKSIGCKAGISEAITELVDLTGTIYALTGIDPDYTHFSKSLLPILKGETVDHRDAAYCEGGRLLGEIQAMEFESTSSKKPEGLYWPRVCLQTTDEKPYHGKAAMCRTKTHKYVMRLYEKDELYDLTADPDEAKNLIDDQSYAPILSQLKQKMLTWYMETADWVPKKPDKRNIYPNLIYRVKSWFVRV